MKLLLIKNSIIVDIITSDTMIIPTEHSIDYDSIQEDFNNYFSIGDTFDVVYTFKHHDSIAYQNVKNFLQTQFENTNLAKLMYLCHYYNAPLQKDVAMLFGNLDYLVKTDMDGNIIELYKYRDENYLEHSELDLITGDVLHTYTDIIGSSNNVIGLRKDTGTETLYTQYDKLTNAHKALLKDFEYKKEIIRMSVKDNSVIFEYKKL